MTEPERSSREAMARPCAGKRDERSGSVTRLPRGGGASGASGSRPARERHHAALVRAGTDRALTLAHLDVEVQLALVDHVPQPRGDRTGRAFQRAADVLDADLEADGRMIRRQLI